jgi:hypothetical protein
LLREQLAELPELYEGGVRVVGKVAFGQRGEAHELLIEWR